MMAMGMLIREMGNRVRAIQTVDPETLIKNNLNHPFIGRVLCGETSFALEVSRGEKQLIELCNGKPQYFDLTPEYGELVQLLRGDLHLCCENKEPTKKEKKEAFWANLFLFGIFGFGLLVVFLGGLALWYSGISTGEFDAVFVGLIMTWLPYGIYKLERVWNGSTSVEKSFNSFFRWAPPFWGTMLEKAQEVDKYLEEHPELRSRI